MIHKLSFLRKAPLLLSFKFLSFFAFFFIFSFNIFAQKYTSENKKAINNFNDALLAIDARKIDKAIDLLLSAIKNDSLFIEPYLALGDIYIDKQENSKAIGVYRKALAINPSFFPMAWLSLGELELSAKNFDGARRAFSQVSKYKVSEEAKEKAEKYLAKTNFIEYSFKNPVPFNPQNLGININTVDNEYLPSLTIDEQTLIFTRRFPRNEETTAPTAEEEDFYISTRNRTEEWGEALRMPAPVNTHGNEGGQCISPDGKFLYFTGCNRPDGFGSCDIYYCELIGNEWSQPKNLGRNVNIGAWESQPSISSDGKTLYFTSNRSGGKGGNDIWKTTRTGNGIWSQPINLGDSINTSGSEVSPFIHPDNKTLYFSSDGHIGMGKLDIFMAKRKSENEWSTAKNIGYPINSENDDASLIVSASGKSAFFASDKLGGFGKLDIYAFDLYEEARPVAVSYLKGFVFDEKNGKKLKAHFEIIDLSTASVVVSSDSDPVTGAFLVSLPSGQNYALNVSADKYLFYSENFNLSQKTTNEPYVKDIALKPISVGDKIVLKNIFFDVNKADLKTESKAELQKLFEFMQQNKTVKFEIEGHTDNTGAAKQNQVLSENRAKAVYDYLVEKGILPSRLSYKGFGADIPIGTNKTEEGKANNRRTEIKITTL